MKTLEINRENFTNYEEFKEYFMELIEGVKTSLSSFLGGRGRISISISENINTFGFNPSTNEIYVPEKWLKNFYENISASKKDNNTYLYTKEDLKFALFHEVSHFRDMMIEKEKKGRNSMLEMLKSLEKEQIKYGENKTIPIAQRMHRVVNCIDDIIVNKEVEVYVSNDVSNDKIKDIYIYNLFPDVYEKEGGAYIISEEGLKYVGEGNGNYEINDSNEVDYSEKQFSGVFGDYLLRGFMVKNQKIQIPSRVNNVLFNNETRKNKISWKRSLKTMISNMREYYDEQWQQADETTKERMEKLKKKYFEQIKRLEGIIEEDEYIKNLLKQCVAKTDTSSRFTADNISLINLINLFTSSTGKDDKHLLDIPPSLRYELYRYLFLPLQKGFILMDLLTQDIKEDENSKSRGEKGEGGEEGEEGEKGEGGEEGEKGEKGEGGEEGEKGERGEEGEGGEGGEEGEIDKSRGSGEGHLHESPDIEDKIRILEDINEEEERREAEELVRKQVEESKYDLFGVLESSDVGQEGKKVLHHLLSQYKDLRKELMDFFVEELKALDERQESVTEHRRKGNLDMDRLRDYLASNPYGTDINKQHLYERQEIIEIIREDLKKIDFTMVIDVSGSVGLFKGPDGILNIISTVIYSSIKQLEEHIRDLIDDPDFEIPVNFILYAQGKPYSSFSSKYSDSPDNVRMAELNEKLISQSGGTNDTTGWCEVASIFRGILNDDEEYVREIGENKRKPVVLQIADTDVSENGVEILKEEFRKKVDPEIVETLPFKRIILGNVVTKTYTQEEYEQMTKDGEISNWEPKRLPDGRIQVKEISIKNKNEILERIKELFANFFADVN